MLVLIESWLYRRPPAWLVELHYRQHPSQLKLCSQLPVEPRRPGLLRLRRRSYSHPVLLGIYPCRIRGTRPLSVTFGTDPSGSKHCTPPACLFACNCSAAISCGAISRPVSWAHPCCFTSATAGCQYWGKQVAALADRVSSTDGTATQTVTDWAAQINSTRRSRPDRLNSPRSPCRAHTLNIGAVAGGAASQ